ncbi:MAG: helix-turn-helix domain-containing protein, partial [Planctomycetota bacterium]
YRLFNLHGRNFSLAGFYLPVLENALNAGREGLGERLSEELAGIVPHGSSTCWGNPVLYLLLDECELSAASEVAERVSSKLSDLLEEEVPSEVLAVASHYRQGSEMYYEMRTRLLPEDCDQKTLSELRSLLAKDVTIKEAKRFLEKHIIERTMRKTGGNITHAARQLGIHRPQLSNLLKKYALKRELFEAAERRGAGAN